MTAFTFSNHEKDVNKKPEHSNNVQSYIDDIIQLVKVVVKTIHIGLVVYSRDNTSEARYRNENVTTITAHHMSNSRCSILPNLQWNICESVSMQQITLIVMHYSLLHR